MYKFDLNEDKENTRGNIWAGMANYYDLSEKVEVDLSEVTDEADEANGAGGAGEAEAAGLYGAANETEASPAEVENTTEQEEEPEEETIDAESGERRFFFRLRNRPLSGEEEERLVADAERKSELSREKKLRKLSNDERKEQERSEIWDTWLQKPAFYVAAGTLLGALILLAVAAVAAAASVSKNTEAGKLTEVHKTVVSGDDGSVIYPILDSYRDFIAHDANVRNDGGETPAPTPEVTERPAVTPVVTPTAPPEETLTPETTEPSTEGPSEGNLVLSTEEDYYVFNLGEKGYTSSRLAPGDVYLSGVGEDKAGTVEVTGDRDCDYGFLRIQNPYKTEGFDLRKVLQSPLIIRRTPQGNTPVAIYYTHTSEGYCITAEERKLSAYPSVSGYDETRSIAGRGNVFIKACQEAGASVALISDINDKNYDLAYEKSGEAVNLLVAENPYVQLTLDLHVNAFEYPKGSRYAPTVTKDGVKYAKILFVITQNDDTNPGWKDNIKLAMLMIEKLEAEVPGITLGISLRNTAKYNSAAAKFGLLAEIGFEGNLVSEADATAELFGRVTGSIFSGK